MLKKILIIAVLTAGISCFARSGIRIDIDGTKNKVILKLGKTSKDLNCFNATWLKDKAKYYIVAQSSMNISKEWRKYSFSFTPDKDAIVNMRFRGAYYKPRGSKKNSAAWVAYDNITIIGAKIKNGDFESLGKRFHGWGSSTGNIVSASEDAQSGKNYAIAWHNKAISQTLKLKKGQKVTINFYAKAYKNPVKVKMLKENSEWKRVNLSSVLIKPGSALDLSNLVHKPAGKYGRVVDRGGFLAFENNPSVPVRFLAVGMYPVQTLRMSQEQNFTEEEYRNRVKRLAKAIRHRGYNMVRLVDPGRFLTRGSKNDMEINPIMMERFDFLMAEFKKEGIYSHLVLLFHGLFASNGGRGDGTFYGARNAHKLGLYVGEEDMRQRFRFGVKELLEHVNPHIGLALKDDPAIAIVEFYNEQELGIMQYRVLDKKFQGTHPKQISLLRGHWQAWLQERFGENPPDGLLEDLNGTPLVRAPLPPKNLLSKPFLSNAFGLFVVDLQEKQVSWYENIVRKAGYRGVTVQHNLSKYLGESLVRWKTMRTIDIHSYFCHPKRVPEIEGRVVTRNSSIETQANYWRETNAGRYSGRPFLVSEYNHAFGNPYQYEGGLVFAAYSALQGFDALMPFALSVILDVSMPEVKLGAFTIGNNPVAIANDFLTACLFARGDVQKSPHLVELTLSQELTESECAMKRAISTKDTLPSLITGFTSAFPWAKTPAGLPKRRKPDLTIVPSGTARVNQQEWFAEVIDEGNDTSYVAKIVTEMKKRGILSPDNLTNPEKGIYQSDTGEIIMRSEEKLLKVITPRSEAVCIQADKSEKLNHLKIISSSVPASIAVCSVDGNPLETSARMVLIYSTVVSKKDMEISEDGEYSLVGSGDPFVTLMRTGTLQLTLKNSMGGKMVLYSLGLDGSRQEKLPLEYSKGVFKITLDTTKLKTITPFFELVKE